MNNINKMNKNKKDIYNDILGGLAHELLLHSQQLKMLTYNLVKKEYDATERYDEYNEIEERLIKKLNKTKNKDLIKLKQLFETMDNMRVSFFNNSEDYFSN